MFTLLFRDCWGVTGPGRSRVPGCSLLARLHPMCRPLLWRNHQGVNWLFRKTDVSVFGSGDLNNRVRGRIRWVGVGGASSLLDSWQGAAAKGLHAKG